MTQPELPAPLAELVRLAAECSNNGDFAGAARHANELVTLLRATLGERNPEVLELKVSLATLQLQAGDVGAYGEFEGLLPDLVEVLGPDHFSTLTARHLLAGRRQAPLSSLAEWSQLFADEQRVLGAEHESTLVAREKIAEMRWEIGDLIGAMDEVEHVLAARRRVLGDEHADTLGTRLMLAIWRGRAGHIPAAVVEIEPLIDELGEKLGDDHAHSLIARHMLTLWAPERAGVTDGVAAWEALVDEEIRVLGVQHPVTIAARQELSQWRTTTGTEDPDDPLEWWLDRINLLIDMMGDVDLDGEIELDYSAASLSALEDAARDRLADPAEALYDDEQAFTAGAVGYLGEALMRVGGGRWEWVAETPADAGVADRLLRQRLSEHRWRIDSAGEPDAGGFPVIRPDPATGLEVLSPTHLLLEAIATDEAAVLAAVYQRWEQAANVHAAAHPGWSPDKEITLADRVFSVPPPSAILDDWLARQQHRFRDWAASTGENLDFSPESIDRLTARVAEVTPTVAALRDPANADFVEGAAYYLGEMLRHATPCRWVYREFRDPGDPITANFEIQKDSNTDFTGPYHLLQNMLEHRDTADTRDFYHRWTKTPTPATTNGSAEFPGPATPP